ncbi:glycosyltransferase involved in cell wall biosynthesis [Edaphobacter aggregans]|jgi:abequosyltransferase|uniref:Glycosyltransferase involved in cell wall biosynthesis n=1 Tax=Edaphobacter aggregans TaxID=570835 RepID=A0A3R9WG36_9BACT|nr:glycosyltransferase family 2 protein [Edaphobacter aggregans]RSL16391.1 glycosyltransferase involved in cell wall biosynthesis [Edaphobacter aggregans]
MQSSRPLLSISIPTYNRSVFLDELLSCLLDQCVSNPKIELLISDNDSSDETPNIVKAYIDRGLEICYLRNASNIGADRNFLQCFERARGKYVWIIGDDDVVTPGAIKKIIAYLEASEYNLIYLNSYIFDDSMSSKRIKSYRAPKVIKDAKVFVRAIHVNLTFISGIITNKDYVMSSNQKDLSSLVGTNLVHLGWTYAALNGYVRGLYIYEELVGMRTNNTGGYMLSQVFGENLNNITEDRLQDPTMARSVINGTLMRFLPAALLKLRRSPVRFEKEQASDTILTPIFGSNFRYWLFVFPILKMPYVLASGWLILIRVFNKLDKTLGSMLMR